MIPQKPGEQEAFSWHCHCFHFCIHTRRLTCKIAFIASAILALRGSSHAQSAPANDNFYNRTVLASSSITFTGTLIGATLESAETDGAVPPSPTTTGGSVWWTWTAPQSGTVTITLVRDNLSVNLTDTRLWVYSGTDITSLTMLDPENGR